MKQKNWQGDLDSHETCSDKRLYAQNDSRCPVAALKLLISKTDPTSTSLFNHCCKDALSSETPNNEYLWYTNKSVKAYQFSRFNGRYLQECLMQYEVYRSLSPSNRHSRDE